VHRTSWIGEALVFRDWDDAWEEMRELERDEENYEIVELTEDMIDRGMREIFEGKLNGTYTGR